MSTSRVRGQAPAHSGRHDWRLPLRLAAVLVAIAAIVWWPRMEGRYGLAFWLWAGALVGYALSFRPAERPFTKPGVLVIALLLGILGLATWLRLTALEDIPANISIDEILPSGQAENMARGAAPNVFSSIGWFGMPNLTFAFPALVVKAVGRNPFLAVRLSSVLTGLAGIVCVFLLARRLFGDRPALVASFLMSVAFWHLHNSRTAFPFVQSSFCTALVIYLLVRAQQDHSRATFAVGGIILGLVLQCYFPVRILLLLCPLFFVADGFRNRVPVGAMLADAASFAGGALLLLGPLLVSVPWDALAGHSQEVLITQPGVLSELSRQYHVSGLLAVLNRNLQEAAGMFTQWADMCVLNRSPAGLLDTGTLVAVIIGVLAAVLQGDLTALLLVSWAALTFVFGVAFTDAPRASYRLAAAMPALFILAAYGIDRGVLGAAPPWRWYRVTIRPALLAVVAAWILTENYRLFFVGYARGDGQETTDGTVRRLLSSHCDGRQFCFVGDWGDPRTPVPQEPPALDLFCPQHEPVAVEQIPRLALWLRPVTFLIPPGDIRIAEILRRCYPGAQVHQHRNRDGRLLLTSVDVTARDLVTGHFCVTGGNEQR